MTYFYILIGLIMVIAFLLIVVIMVQNPKGGGLSSTFGASTQQLGGVKKTGDFLDRSTWVLATALIVLVILASTTLINSDGVKTRDVMKAPVEQTPSK